MRTVATWLDLLRLRTPWVVALCYALLLQAALAPVVRAGTDTPLHGVVTSILCLTDQGDDGTAPGTADHHDMGCCLQASRSDLAAPALLAGVPVLLPEPPAPAFRLAGRPSSPRAPPSVDLDTHAARAPPLPVA
jgi:hypothetical protein